MDMHPESQCIAFKQNHDLRLFFFLALLISCHIPPAITKISPVKDLMTIEQGDEAILSVIVEGNIKETSWYRGLSIPNNLILKMYYKNFVEKGPKYTMKESILPDYSLQIMNASINDSGLYTVHVIKFTFFKTIPTVVESATLNVEVLTRSPSPVHNRSSSPFGRNIMYIIITLLCSLMLIFVMTGVILYLRRRRRQTSSKFDGVTVVKCVYNPHTCYENLEHQVKKQVTQLDQPLNVPCGSSTYMKIIFPEQPLYMHLERQEVDIDDKQQFTARLENILLQVLRNNANQSKFSPSSKQPHDYC